MVVNIIVLSNLDTKSLGKSNFWSVVYTLSHAMLTFVAHVIHEYVPSDIKLIPNKKYWLYSIHKMIEPPILLSTAF